MLGMPIKNIIFDLGAVLLNIDYEGPAKALKAIGITHFETVYSKAKQEKVFDNFEKGRITPYEFRNMLRPYFGEDFTDIEIDKVWNAVILDFPKHRIDLLLSLKNNYRTFLLSNTNSIHYDFYTKDLTQTYNGLNWETLFEKAYFSFEMDARKPEKIIYENAIAQSGIIPEETVFIDDLKENINAATSCGLNAVWLREGIDVVDLFKYDKEKKDFFWENQ